MALGNTYVRRQSQSDGLLTLGNLARKQAETDLSIIYMKRQGRSAELLTIDELERR